MTEETLLPCPFCGAGETQIREQSMWGGRSKVVVSVSVIHWCEKEEGQPSRAIERIGRDRESAIRAWNQRATTRLTLSPKLPMTLKDGTVLEEGKWPFPTGLKPKEGT